MAYEHSQRGLRLRRYYFMFIFIFRPPGSPMNENSGTDRGGPRSGSWACESAPVSQLSWHFLPVPAAFSSLFISTRTSKALGLFKSFLPSPLPGRTWLAPLKSYAAAERGPASRPQDHCFLSPSVGFCLGQALWFCISCQAFIIHLIIFLKLKMSYQEN